MTEMFGEAWSPMSVPDLAPDDDDVYVIYFEKPLTFILRGFTNLLISSSLHLTTLPVICTKKKIKRNL